MIKDENRRNVTEYMKVTIPNSTYRFNPTKCVEHKKIIDYFKKAKVDLSIFGSYGARTKDLKMSIQNDGKLNVIYDAGCYCDHKNRIIKCNDNIECYEKFYSACVGDY
jgi:spore coat polysaccharide biosynthesis predicted glycosyltransferase SpsG